jgi:diguanylate cyclase (GGDEF)-like protein/PAS domain S-box-containing protein
MDVQSARSPTSPGTEGPIRIVLVEDNTLDVELVLQQLRREGVACASSVAVDEHSFRLALAEFAPHLILSDFSLPQFDGLAALRIAREVAPQVPFIFVSGTIGEERAISALKNGASDYVLKDNLRRLVPAIQGALRAADTERARDVAVSMLRRSEARLRDIINTSADWVWECDENWRFTFSSPSVERILGHRPEAMLQEAALSFVHPADRERLRAAFDSGGSDAETTAPLVLRWKHKDGRIRWLERKMVQLHGEDGDLRGYRGIDRDVTSRRVQEERIARLNRAISFLSGINSTIVRIRDHRELLHEACRLAVQVGEYSMATVYLRQAAGRDPIVHRAVSTRHSGFRRPEREPIDGDGPVGRAMSEGRRIVVRDVADAAVAISQRERLLEMGVRACIAQPLTIDGTSVGVLLLHADDPSAFSDAELALLSQVTGNIAFALQYLRSRESIEYLEYFDTLTALANRTLYVQRLGDAIRTTERDGDHLALLICDVAGLNVINDGLGHHAGDLVLQLVAERLKNVFHDSGSLCHLGGGAFAAFSCHPPTGTDAPTVLRERMQVVFDEPFRVADQEIRLSARAGFAAFPEDGEDANALLQHARTALDHAKQSGEVFSRHRPSMSAAASERLNLITRLRAAAARQEFVLNYQPKVRLADGRIEGVEALIRWPGSDISPAVFVPLLESLGLIGDVGRWVLAKALEEGTPWVPDARAGEFRIAVNISALQLRRERFAEEVLEAAAAAGNGNARLELEITESVLMDDTRRASALLERLRDAGITVAIDDFGTGHASLQILSQLPVDTLKIDRSFVQDIASNERHRRLVELTLMLARSFGLATVAEGVENEGQAAILREMGCDAMQGYLVLRPANAHEFAAWLATRTAAA